MPAPVEVQRADGSKVSSYPEHTKGCPWDAKTSMPLWLCAEEDVPRVEESLTA